MKLLCTKCWNFGVISERVLIPRSELSPQDHAELLVLGGHAYRIVQHPCPCGRTPRKDRT